MADANQRKLKQRVSIKWDERNLEENEKIKAELPPVKITEPKTPYHAALEGDASGLEPLDLDEDLDGVSHTAGQHHGSKDQKAAQHEQHDTDDKDFAASRRSHYKTTKEALAASRKLIEQELAEEETGGNTK